MYRFHSVSQPEFTKAMKDSNKNSKSKGHPYFEGHKCNIPSSKLSRYEVQCSRFRGFLLDLMSVRQADPRARRMFRSYEALRAERYRQYKLYPASIHPYSPLRLAAELFFVVMIFITSVMIALLIGSCTDETQHYAFGETIRIIENVYLVNILMNFFTGFVEGITMRYVVLDSRRIICRYLRTWFVLDVLSSAFLVSTHDHDKVRLSLVTAALTILKIPTMIRYMFNVLDGFNIEVLTRVLIQTFVYFSMYLSWNIFFQFALEYFHENSFTPSTPRTCSWITIGKLWNETTAMRLAYSLDRAVGVLRSNTNFELIRYDGCFEAFFVQTGLVAKFLVIHCSLKYMIVLFGMESARARYHMMIQQVHTYSDQRNLPPRIKKKILKYYAIRFQYYFFSERKMLSCVTGKLREDIIMHTSRQLVRNVKFLKNMPRGLMLDIELKLKIDVFIAGDIIIKINTVGDCLYFIDKGTVAVYSESGKEVCHLEDGDFFGEIALIKKRGLRTASVVAVTNCELFRLNRQDFESTIACYHTVYEDIKQEATNRFETTRILDEHHKSVLKDQGLAPEI